ARPITRYWVFQLRDSGGTMIVTLPFASVVPLASYDPYDTGAHPAAPPTPSAPSKMTPHFFGFSAAMTLPTHDVAVENTFTTAFGAGMTVTFGFDVLSCSSNTLYLTCSFADGVMTCANAADVLPVTLVLPP